MMVSLSDPGFWVNASVLLMLVTLLYSPLWLGLFVRFWRQRWTGKQTSRRLAIALSGPFCVWAAFGAAYLVIGYVQDAPARQLETEVATFADEIAEFSFVEGDRVFMNRRTDCAATDAAVSLAATIDDTDFRARIARLQEELRSHGWVTDIQIDDFRDGYAFNYPWRGYFINARRARTSVSISIKAGYRPGDPLPSEFGYSGRYLDTVTGGIVSAHFQRCRCDHQVAFVPTTCGTVPTALAISHAEFSPDRRKILIWAEHPDLANWRCNHIDAGVEPDGLMWTIRYRSTSNGGECLPAPPTELGYTASIDLIEPAPADVVLLFG